MTARPSAVETRTSPPTQDDGQGGVATAVNRTQAAEAMRGTRRSSLLEDVEATSMIPMTAWPNAIETTTSPPTQDDGQEGVINHAQAAEAIASQQGEGEGMVAPTEDLDTVQFFRIKVTGYRLLTTALVLGLGIPKAVLSYTNSKAPTTFDWIIGTVIFLVTSWIGYYEQERPPVQRWFFHVDYSWHALWTLVLAASIGICYVAALLLGYLIFLIAPYIIQQIQLTNGAVYCRRIYEEPRRRERTMAAVVGTSFVLLAVQTAFARTLGTTRLVSFRTRGRRRPAWFDLVWVIGSCLIFSLSWLFLLAQDCGPATGEEWRGIRVREVRPRWSRS